MVRKARAMASRTQAAVRMTIGDREVPVLWDGAGLALLTRADAGDVKVHDGVEIATVAYMVAERGDNGQVVQLKLEEIPW